MHPGERRRATDGDGDRTPGAAWATALVVERPALVVGVFLAFTVVFAVGLTNVTTETGTESFAEDLPEQAALDAVNREFAPPFAPSESTTQLIQRGENVLSREALVAMLRVQEQVTARPDFRVVATRSAAAQVARELDPGAETPAAQRRAVERSTPAAIDSAVRRAAETPGFARLLSTDFNPAAARASATIGLVDHRVPAAAENTEPIAPIQVRMSGLVGAVDAGITVFGAGIIEGEFGAVIGDTLLLVVPASVILITLFLVIAYRDLLDLLLGLSGLAMVVVWTFGALGLAGIPFDQILIAVPPLLLAVGIDYGIHTVNRYREERTAGATRRPAMQITVRQLVVAFGIVTATSAIGFAANLTSELVPIQRFGAVAAIGIVVTALVFGVFFPAAKLLVDGLRERTRLPNPSRRPIGTAGSWVGRALGVGIVFARRSPAIFLALVVVVTGAAGGYATGVDTEFSQENFLPSAETPAVIASLPEPFRPGEYTVTRTLNFLEDRFETGEADTVTVYVRGPMESPIALERLARAGTDPPDTFVTEADGTATATSILTIIRAQAERDPDFRELVRRNDRDGDGVPDRNLDLVYDALLSSPAREAALSYLTENRRSTRAVYSVEADADSAQVTADARTVADRHPYAATPTGEIVVFQTVADLILQSALGSLAVALVGTALALAAFFWLLFGRPTLGLAGLVPIVATVALVGASMRALDIAFNAFTATVLALTIGLGIDYAVHVLHRFADERRAGEPVEAALVTTITGTGSALAGSMLTTAFGLGVLGLATFPAIGQFGLLAGLSVLFAFLTSVLVLPSVLTLRARLGTAVAPESDPVR
jgi:predicted RND superfamily exporter protein